MTRRAAGTTPPRSGTIHQAEATSSSRPSAAQASRPGIEQQPDPVLADLGPGHVQRTPEQVEDQVGIEPERQVQEEHDHDPGGEPAAGPAEGLRQPERLRQPAQHHQHQQHRQRPGDLGGSPDDQQPGREAGEGSRAEEGRRHQQRQRRDRRHRLGLDQGRTGEEVERQPEQEDGEEEEVGAARRGLVEQPEADQDESPITDEGVPPEIGVRLRLPGTEGSQHQVEDAERQQDGVARPRFRRQQPDEPGDQHDGERRPDEAEPGDRRCRCRLARVKACR